MAHSGLLNHPLLTFLATSNFQLRTKSAESMAGSSMVINVHQIIINSQNVPDWFMQEYSDSLSHLDDAEMKKAFEKGDVFYNSRPSHSKPIASYASVAKNI